MQKKKLNIVILAGGESTEREVSLNSARAVTESLARSGHRVRVVDTLTGRCLTDHSGVFLPLANSSEADSGEGATIMPQVMMPESARELINLNGGAVDVVFNALHGGLGENGGIQALLDILRLPYTGSPMAASAIAMNKDIAKRVMRSLGIPTADWRRYDASAISFDEIVAEIARREISLPFIVKPTDGGSTVGLTLVENEVQIADAVRAAFAVSDSLIVEKYLAGREITIAVLDGRGLPPVEIKPTHKLYDYACKYTKGKSRYFCPADVDGAIAARLSDDAVRFYNTIGCRGYARVDFIVASADDYICLELNTLPGMTSLSLFPMAARAAGIEFDELLERLCYLALEGR